jgi:hypothetical protein
VERSFCRVARGYGQSVSTILRDEKAEDVRLMGRHLSRLQVEEAELLADLIADRLTRSAIDILKIVGILESESKSDPDQSPEEAAVIREAEALLRRHTKRR